MTASIARSAINWFEIPCTDLQRAQAFYEAMLGRSMHRDSCSDTPMVIFAYDDPATGGCLVHGGNLKPSNDAGVRIYLDCEPSVEAAMARAATETAQAGPNRGPAGCRPCGRDRPGRRCSSPR